MKRIKSMTFVSLMVSLMFVFSACGRDSVSTKKDATCAPEHLAESESEEMVDSELWDELAGVWVREGDEDSPLVFVNFYEEEGKLVFLHRDIVKRLRPGVNTPAV
ncbi:MAG: hypothetical protein RR998_10100 [Oscillospiraceae bacterium]